MSRYSFDKNGERIVVGWDPPMQTFFIQRGPIFNGNWVGDGPQLWIGTAWQELHSIGQVVTLDDDYELGISNNLIQQLEMDQEQNV